MGKPLIQQKRGKGSPRYRSPSFRFKGKVTLARCSEEIVSGDVLDLIKCPGHSSPLMHVKYENGEEVLLQAPEGVKVGEKISMGEKSPVGIGNVLALKNIPEGTPVYNIEGKPGDGGKFVRASGGFAKIVTKFENKIVVQLPSNKKKNFLPECKAIVGIIAGSGRKEKPFLKAGTKHYAMKARNKMYPSVSGTSMNAISHPFGGSSSGSKGRPTQSSRHAPPGRKVGKIAPKRTGRRKK